MTTRGVEIQSTEFQQSKVENTFYRYKAIIGRRLRARIEKGREVEALLGCLVLNRFTELGICRLEFVV